MKLQYFGHLMHESWLIGKDSDAGRDWRQEEKGTTEDEMAGWHHRLDGHEFEWIPGVGDGQGGLACCDSWGRKELEMTEWLNWTELKRLSTHAHKEIEHLRKSSMKWRCESHSYVHVSATQLGYMLPNGRNKLLSACDLLSPPLRILHSRGLKYLVALKVSS